VQIRTQDATSKQLENKYFAKNSFHWYIKPSHAECRATPQTTMSLWLCARWTFDWKWDYCGRKRL